MKTTILLILCALLPLAAPAKRPLDLNRIGISVGGFRDPAFAATPAQQSGHASIASPQRIPFPNRTDDFMRKFYQARARHLVMINSNLVERSTFAITDTGVVVRPDAQQPDPQVMPATYEQFLAAVNAGYEFKTTVPGSAACRECLGTKLQPQTGRARTMKRMCPTCAGSGSQSTTLAAVIVATP